MDFDPLCRRTTPVYRVKIHGSSISSPFVPLFGVISSTLSSDDRWTPLCTIRCRSGLPRTCRSRSKTWPVDRTGRPLHAETQETALAVRGTAGIDYLPAAPREGRSRDFKAPVDALWGISPHSRAFAGC